MRYGGLIAAIVFAAIAAVVVLKMSTAPSGKAPVTGTNQQAPQNVATVPVYVAATAIPIGSVITKEMVAAQPWPEHLALPGFMSAKEGAEPIEGMVARAPFQTNEPIVRGKLANPNDPSFLAGDLPKGMRVVTIPINEVDGLAGFIFPGDHVDVMYTHDVAKWVTPPPSVFVGDRSSASLQPEKVNIRVTETLLTNVKVLAIDQRASNAGATDQNGKLVIPRSASLMVSLEDAQRLRLGQKVGSLSLALRSLEDKESVDPLVLTRPNDISQTKQADLDLDGSNMSDDSIRIVRGAPQQNTTTDPTAGFLKMLGAMMAPSGAAAPSAPPTSPVTVVP